MATDPLSSATRTNKRNLIAAASAVILLKTYSGKVEKLPVGGVTFRIEPGAVMFALVVTVAYFLTTFAMYYWIDLKDNKPIEYEVSLRKWYDKALHNYRISKGSRLEKEIRKKLSLGQDVIFQHSFTETLFFNYGWRALRLPRSFTRKQNELGYPVKFGRSLSPVLSEITRLNEEQNKLLDQMDAIIYFSLFAYRMTYPFRQIQFFITYATKKSVFIIRNYFFDGILPLALGVAALSAAYDLVPLDWLKELAPPVNASAIQPNPLIGPGCVQPDGCILNM